MVIIPFDDHSYCARSLADHLTIWWSCTIFMASNQSWPMYSQMWYIYIFAYLQPFGWNFKEWLFDPLIDTYGLSFTVLKWFSVLLKRLRTHVRSPVRSGYGYLYRSRSYCLVKRQKMNNLSYWYVIGLKYDSNSLENVSLEDFLLAQHAPQKITAPQKFEKVPFTILGIHVGWNGFRIWSYMVNNYG